MQMTPLASRATATNVIVDDRLFVEDIVSLAKDTGNSAGLRAERALDLRGKEGVCQVRA